MRCCVSDRPARRNGGGADGLWFRVESLLMLLGALGFAALHYHGVYSAVRAVWAFFHP